MNSNPEVELVREEHSRISLELNKADTVEGVLGLALGAASSCWGDLAGAGTFDSDQARLILQDTVERLKQVPSEGGVARMQAQVKEFHAAMGQPVGTYARSLPADRVPVRVELIREEFEDELLPALEAGDIVETADALIDILYVTFGALVEMGINAQVLFDEVQRSNMSKFGADGKPIIAGPNDPDGIFEGRVKKGPNYFKPDIEMILTSGEADLGD